MGCLSERGGVKNWNVSTRSPVQLYVRPQMEHGVGAAGLRVGARRVAAGRRGQRGARGRRRLHRYDVLELRQRDLLVSGGAGEGGEEGTSSSNCNECLCAGCSERGGDEAGASASEYRSVVYRNFEPLLKPIIIRVLQNHGPGVSH